MEKPVHFSSQLMEVTVSWEQWLVLNVRTVKMIGSSVSLGNCIHTQRECEEYCHWILSYALWIDCVILVTAYHAQRVSEEVRGQVFISSLLLRLQNQDSIKGNERMRASCSTRSNKKFLSHFTLLCFIASKKEKQSVIPRSTQPQTLMTESAWLFLHLHHYNHTK